MKIYLKMFVVIASVLTIFAVTSSPAKCDPNVRYLDDALAFDACSCRIGENGPYSVGYVGGQDPQSGPTGWVVDAGPCPGVGTACPTREYGSTIYNTVYTVPQGKCYHGYIRWKLVANGTVPTCQGSTPPTCPAAGPFTYSLEAPDLTNITITNCP
jgi:hypothetical protein